MDRSNGYENISLDFLKARSNANNKIGVSTVSIWAQSLSKSSAVLDLGCGSGIPITKTLIEQDLIVYGIDASQTLSTQFKKNFPNSKICCESVEESSFFNLAYDGIIAWGLLFLLSAEKQAMLIGKMARHLKRGGKLLFTSPSQQVKWKDAMTGLTSESLGAQRYRKLLKTNELQVQEEYTDEGDNYYYSAAKVG